MTWLERIERRVKLTCVAHRIHVSEGEVGAFFFNLEMEREGDGAC